MSSILTNYQLKNAPIPQTHFNADTPYFAEVNDADVQNITNLLSQNITTTNIKVTGNIDASGAVMTSNLNMNGNSIINSNLLPSQTVFSYDSGAITVAQPISAGYTQVNVGSPITVAKTGLYVLSGTFGVNVDATNGATFGATDDIGVTLVPTPPVPGVNPVAIDFHPYSMPNTASGGADYGAQSSMVVKMTAGVPYQPKYWTDNLGGTMAAAGGLAMEMTLTALC